MRCRLRRFTPKFGATSTLLKSGIKNKFGETQKQKWLYKLIDSTVPTRPSSRALASICSTSSNTSALASRSSVHRKSRRGSPSDTFQTRSRYICIWMYPGLFQKRPRRLPGGVCEPRHPAGWPYIAHIPPPPSRKQEVAEPSALANPFRP